MTAGIQTKPAPYCPDCGAKMVLKRPPEGAHWKPFWGCSEYPDCRGTRNVGPDGKPEDDTGGFAVGDFE